MKAFKDQPLGLKALTLGVVPSVCAVTLLGVASMTLTYFRAQTNIKADLAAQAAIIVEGVGSAVAVNDSGTANAALATLRLRSNVDVVCIFDETGRLFASYEQPAHPCESTLFKRPLLGRSAITLEHPILAGTRQIGTVRVGGNMARFYGWMRVQAVGILIALIVAAAIAFALTRRLQPVISKPVLDLAATADAVSASRNYSLRAAKSTDDEVGGLVQSFNSMLDEIQRQNHALTVEIAERRRAEELKDAFLASVSHELRTPLNAILGRLQLVRHMKPTGEPLERALDSLERNAQSQARLVEDLLDVSRIVSGKFDMKFEVVDLRAVIAHAVDVVLPQAAVKSIRITRTAPEAPCLISGDEERLQQAVMNLLSNAVKFSGPGGVVALELSVDEATQEFAICVKDGGIGITPEFLPDVFDRFRQADGSMTRQHGGLGLGLAIVKEVAELHGGSVVASSRGLGHGATFTIRFPQLVEADRAGRGQSRPLLPIPAPISLHQLRILVVDDEPESLDIAATSLKETGATVAIAASGSEALERWQEAGPFDALVCDLAMPGMDGFEVVEKILEVESPFGRTPVTVALTAYASNEHRARSRAAGFQIHMAKPYSTRDLVVAIAEGFERLGNGVVLGSS